MFAKSDMIHLQQEGTPACDIVAGLCFAMARNLVAVVGKGKEFRPRIAFQGGVAANAGMVRALTEILALGPCFLDLISSFKWSTPSAGA